MAYGQVVTDYPVYINFHESYQGGGYDNDGNYIPGFVTTQLYNVNCGKAVKGIGGPQSVLPRQSSQPAP